MQDPKDLIQEKLVTKSDNPNPDYHTTLQAYTDDPLYDMTVKPHEKERPKTEENKI